MPRKLPRRTTSRGRAVAGAPTAGAAADGRGALCAGRLAGGDSGAARAHASARPTVPPTPKRTKSRRPTRRRGDDPLTALTALSPIGCGPRPRGERDAYWLGRTLSPRNGASIGGRWRRASGSHPAGGRRTRRRQVGLGHSRLAPPHSLVAPDVPPVVAGHFPRRVVDLAGAPAVLDREARGRLYIEGH